MTAPIFQREGARIGGVTTDGISMVARTDSNGARLYLDVYNDSTRLRLVSSSSAGTLDAANNYCTTVRVTGLQPGKKYYWRARADDGSSGSTNGNDATFSQGEFKTVPLSGSWRIGFYACDPMNPTSGFNIAKSPQIWQQIALKKCDQIINTGDFYYSDIGTNNATADYASGAWRNPANDAAATLSAYRTNIISCLDEFNRRGFYNFKSDLFIKTPLTVMWDDHDRGWDDMSGQGTWSADQQTRAANALQAGHEMFMSLSAPYIENDNRPFVKNSTTDDWHHIDIGSARIVVLNCRQYRDLKSGTDTPAKTMLGATQKAWLKNKISENTQKYLIIVTPLMLDGYHGWNESTTDGWVSCSYERDEILDYIRDFGDPARTLIVEGDTHAGCISKYDGDLIAVTAGNLWPDSGHGYINGWKAGASGRGGDLIKMRVNEPNMLIVDISDTVVEVRLVELLTGNSVFNHFLW